MSQGPSSPNFLDSPPPIEPEDTNDDVLQPLPNLPDSETFTPPPPEDSASNDSIRTPPYNEDSESNPISISNEVPNIDNECKRDSDEPPAKIRKISAVSDDDQDGETCPICLDCWNNSGDHRLVALKCGHLFGAKCVERWLRAQTLKERSCPTCKSKAAVKDIRFIYARRLVAADTSEITNLQKQIDFIKSEKSRVELELHKTKLAHRACLEQLDMYKILPSTSQSIVTNWRFALLKNLEVCKDGACRVLTYNCRSYDLYVSQKSTNNLFPGYGIRKINCVDFKLGQFTHLHPKPIRDISYSQPNDFLLSASLDGTSRIVKGGQAAFTVNCGSALWSCAWSQTKQEEFYLGGVGGIICKYDIRNTSQPMLKLTSPQTTPVISLSSTEFGLLVCQLNCCQIYSTSYTDRKPIPIEGPFLSMCYESESNRVAISCRPKGVERSKIVVYSLNFCSEVECEYEQSFFGSTRATVMSRATWIKNDSSLWIAAHSESDSALLLHGVDGAKTSSLPASELALDICSARLNGQTLFASLSESRLRLYKAISPV